MNELHPLCQACGMVLTNEVQFKGIISVTQSSFILYVDS